MTAFNKIVLVGNLGRDAENKDLNNGGHVLTFNLAVSEKWEDKDGQQQERTDWFTVDYFCKSAGLQQYLTKGTSVLVEGKMISREYEDKEGKKRTAWSVRADKVGLLGGSKKEVETSDSPY